MVPVLCPSVIVSTTGWVPNVIYHVCMVRSYQTCHVTVMAATREPDVMTHVEDMEIVWTINVSADQRMGFGVRSRCISEMSNIIGCSE